jgi:hypothetical protein
MRRGLLSVLQQAAIETIFPERSEEVMRYLLAILLLGWVGTAAAQGVPKIDIGPSCRAAAAGSKTAQDVDSCRRSELAARESLVNQWNSFPATDRNGCYRLTTTGTPGTYSELLTCLEMRRDARNLKNRK